MAPAVVRIQGNGISACRAVCIQLCLYARRSDAVLVVRVIPYLRYRDSYLVRCMTVRDDEAVGRVAGYRLRVSGRYRYFIYCVGDFGSVVVLIQIRPSVVPVVLCVQRYCYSARCAVCIQLCLYTRRTDVILVVGIVPDLRDGNTGQFLVRYGCFDGIAVCVIGNAIAATLNTGYNKLSINIADCNLDVLYFIISNATFSFSRQNGAEAVVHF